MSPFVVFFLSNYLSLSIYEKKTEVAESPQEYFNQGPASGRCIEEPTWDFSNEVWGSFDDIYIYTIWLFNIAMENHHFKWRF